MQEVLTPAQMAEADRRTIDAGTPGIALMERAGHAVAEAVLRRAQGEVLVLCGPGNNGGDGFIAARLLRERGIPVRLVLVGHREQLKGDAAEAARRWGDPIEPFNAPALADARLIVDALYGAGLTRDLAGDSRAAVEAINGSGAFVLAVDLPSGIDAASGQVRGAAVRAHMTVTFCRKKPGLVLLPGRLYAGAIELADIGIPETSIGTLAPKTYINEPSLWLAAFPRPRVDGHKYDRGHAVVVSGPAAATGAARLAARAALRAGAGLVTVAGPRTAVPVLAASLTAVMVREANGAKGLAKLLADPRLDTVLLGPGQGVGPATRAAVSTAAKPGRKLVLDADALTSFAKIAQKLAQTLKRAKAAVVTPHEGEFKQLFSSNRQITGQESKLERARAAARLLNAVVVLKGPDTVVAEPAGRAAIAENAPPWLATAGSGDVLAGLVTGLLAQGMPTFEAAAAAVWLHGEAGKEFGPGLIAEDLTEMLPRVYRRVFDQGGPPAESLRD